MDLDFGNLNWLAILLSVVIGQVVLTVWFAVLFAEPWARAYGAADKAEHTKDIPAYTYGIGVACMVLLTVGLALFQQSVGVQSFGGGLATGIFVALFFALATALPGYAFLKKLDAAAIAIGSQCVVILIVSCILAIWT
ncbi:MAG: DUF1761 domain-containing protein [Alphaproteobacteria bacterium]|nr:DUF1761 domain-containing protein [Alphaproteobacteria bacterium]